MDAEAEPQAEADGAGSTPPAKWRGKGRRFSTWFRPDELAALDTIAKHLGLSRSATIQALVRRGAREWPDQDTDTSSRLAAAENEAALLRRERDSLKRQLQPDLKLGQVLKQGQLLRFPVPEYMAANAEKILAQAAEHAQDYARRHIPSGPRREAALREAGALLEQANAFGEMAARYGGKRDG